MDDDFTGEDVEVSAGVTLDGAQDAPSDAYETVETVDPETEEDVLDETDGGDQGDDPEVINENKATLDTTVNVVSGDRVIITLIDGEPVVTGVVGGGDNMAADVSAAGETATAYITEIDSNGISVHAENNVSTNYAQINANGMEVVKGGTSVAQFGTTARIGSATGQNIKIDNDSVDICTGSTVDATLHAAGASFLRGDANIAAFTYDDAFKGIAISSRDANTDIKIVNGLEDGGGTAHSGIMISKLIAWGYQESIEEAFGINIIKAANGFSVIGDIVSKNQTTNVSTASSAYTNICSISIGAGTWTLFGNVRFANNATGRRGATIAPTSQGTNEAIFATSDAVDGSYTRLNVSGVVEPTATTTYYLVGWQNSGAALNAVGYLRAVRIK